MKPLSELVKEWKKGPHVYYSGRMTAANELQAWLREADEWVCQDRPSWSPSQTWGAGPIVDDVRRELLGTTQKPKQEGEK